MRAILVSYLCLFFIYSCSGIKFLQTKENYNKEFISKIDRIKAIYKNGDREGALRRLGLFDDKKLTGPEKAVKYNLEGIILYSKANYTEALNKFDKASLSVDKDSELRNKIYLNLASTYFKLKNFEKAFEVNKFVESEYLSSEEEQSHYKLYYLLSYELKKDEDLVRSVSLLLKKEKEFQALENSPYKEGLLSSYENMESENKILFLKKINGIVPAYLLKIESQKKYFSGSKQEALEIISYLDNNYRSFDDVANYVDDFYSRLSNYSKIETFNIGVVLPLSGNNKSFGERILKGIEVFMSEAKSPYEIYSADGQDNPLIASRGVQSLVEKHKVSLIIGGLFPSTAKEEYLEAKKYGVLFISLSQVFLPKEEKNHLLIEIPGSVESQISEVLSKEALHFLGHKVAVLYPSDESGNAYIREIFRQKEQKKFELSSVDTYEKTIKDYREPVMGLLGLKFKRERQEEFELWKDVYKAEGKSSIRRIQTLNPVIDFDWVFLPSYPHEALQIIPAFGYYDASGLKFVGGPSWLSKSLVKEQKNLGKIYLIGDNPEKLNNKFLSHYKEKYGDIPRLIETLGYESIYLAKEILGDEQFKKRDDLESHLVRKSLLQGVTGKFSYIDGIWIKEMDFLRINKNGVQKINLDISDNKDP